MDDAYTDGLCFIGAATTLVRYAGFTVLTDPNFLHRGERGYLGNGRRTTRRTEARRCRCW
jgi:predicted pyridoxine 5'-phosphate oxidase superfamily flavin-nucleotide-binding protein